MNLQAYSKLVAQFCKLPGIGAKTAQRLAYYILKMPETEVKQFAVDMYDARRKVKYCAVCGNLSEGEVCEICADAKRDPSIICVVKDTRDVFAIEKTHEYRGLYHVLGGTISPLEGIGPDDIAIKPLLGRLTDEVKEIILATNPDVQGEATAAYIGRLLKGFGVKVTRIAHGIPIGAELEYADEITLAKALEGRTLV
ncbi:MAG: recombination mediator RecR [Christensenella sp.]|uniref:recombination mediator RecR n=1 Tax=Christensenella sp. TaxID=1935934 RepID=UPI002B214EF0|nr:recombination mediator RecR [Christensenella sp.]MEA5002465.1 recombination mediator RecR [Christensenella sp.]